MKNLFKIISVSVLLFFAVFTASAQLGTNTTVTVGNVMGGIYSTRFNGGTNVIAVATTNVNWTLVTNAYSTYTNTNQIPTVNFPVSMHANVGFTVYWFNPTITATNGSNIIKLVRSFDNGNTYETAPFAIYTNVLPTAVQQAALGVAQTNVWCFDVPVTNATHVGIAEIDSSSGNATGWFSNYTVNVNMNNNSVWTVPGPR